MSNWLIYWLLEVLMRVLVTGSSGFIGTNLIEALVALKERTDKGRSAIDICIEAVLGIDRVDPRQPLHIPWFKCVDIRNYSALLNVICEFAPTHIVHLAARTDLDGATVGDYDANTDGVRNIVRVAEDALGGEVPVLFASSRLVCEISYIPSHDQDYKATTPYGESKIVGEKIVRDQCLKTQWTIFRPTSIWGPWFGTPYRNFFDAVVSGKYFHPANLRIRKSFGYVGNSVAQIIAMLGADRESVHERTFYMSDYEPIDVLEWANFIKSESGGDSCREIPLPFLGVAAKVGDFVQFGSGGRVKAPLTSFRLNNLCQEMLLPTWGMDTVLPVLPFNWHDGVRSTLNWSRTVR